jgi:hypothetical protein
MHHRINSGLIFEKGIQPWRSAKASLQLEMQMVA